MTQAETTQGTGADILVAEDNPVQAKLIARLLEMAAVMR